MTNPLPRCPNPSQLAAFAEGRLEPAQRDPLIQHMELCPSCFAIYSDALAYLSEAEPPTPIRKFPRLDWRTYIALAAAATLAFFFLHRLNSVDDIDMRYQLVTTASEIKHARRALAILARLQATQGGKDLALMLSDNDNPEAQAFIGKGIVLSKGALGLCYRGVTETVGDARLALVLGHELAHYQASEDLRAFAPNQGQPPSLSEEARNALHLQEIRADQLGLVMAAQAGFEPDLVLKNSQDFFSSWLTRPVSMAAFSDHPQPEDRARFVRGKLEKIAESIESFQLGVRLYQSGHYRFARDLFAAFAKDYPGRETHNNLGLATLQLAILKLAQCDPAATSRFALPFQIDPRSLATSHQRRGNTATTCLENPELHDLFMQAYSLFELATRQDPTYVPAWMNLFSTQVLMGTPGPAIDSSEKLTVAAGDTAETTATRALASYLFAESKGLQSQKELALGQMRIAASESTQAWPTYNLAALLEESGAEADQVWSEFLAKQVTGPHARIARKQLGLDQIAPQTSAPFGTIPFALGPLSTSNHVRLQEMKRVNLSSRLSLYTHQGFRVLLLEEEVILVEQTLQSPLPYMDLPPSWQQAKRLTSPAGFCLVAPNQLLSGREGQVTDVIWYMKPL